MVKLVILDRDGVINEDSDAFIKSPAEWEPIPGALEAIARLNRAGYKVVVASNQSGVGRGLFDVQTLAAIHQRLRSELLSMGGHIDAIFYCPHHPEEGCRCRKPAPGLFEEIRERFNTALEGVPAVGDSLRDLEAARAAGAMPILVRTGKGEATLAKGQVPADVPVYENLEAVVKALLANPA
ncbi:MAG: D-glycero-beta-D-manno-heptose 1,7-bisphosphate 7-phosphatase [Pseudomonadota bacterium]|uniref:D-glycero-beta-D-manno-heptose 1,7-bisphosphate 7-phosphatase n=1 Tax=Thermithiobacillus tepidarius TaxID=929 RepID=UPI0003FBD2C9|nr:D-glycero-beta-D-manno-heptose 1,7-bisphosphate 7-phosphatase [Thermithiobacillus tepidarius]